MNPYNNLQPLPSQCFVAVDVEYAVREKFICQLGLAVVRGNERVEMHRWLIQPPDNRYEEGTMRKHHITPDDTVHAPTFPEVWPEIEPYLSNQELWAHNASVEHDALEATLCYYNIPHSTYNFLDSIHLFRRPDRTGWNHGNSLRACCYAVGLPCENHHDAGADAAMCADIILQRLRGVEPDWERSDAFMAQYEAEQRAAENDADHAYQAQQLDLFADVLSTSKNDSSDSGVGESTPASPTFYNGSFDSKQDGPDRVDFARLNTADTNPICGASVVLTGFFHIRRTDLREALKRMGATIRQGITKNIQVVLLGERNVGPSKTEELQRLIHNGYNIARISGDADLDRLLYDPTLTPSDFCVPQAAKKELNFTVKHFRDHHHNLAFPINSISGRELYFPPTGLMGPQNLFCQMCGNLGSFGNWDLNSQVNLVVLPNATVAALQRGEKDQNILDFERFYNAQRSVTFDADFITERDILKFVRERIVRDGDEVTGRLYTAYIQAAGIDPEEDFKYGLRAARKAVQNDVTSTD